MRESPVRTVIGLIGALVALSLGFVVLSNGVQFWTDARELAQWQTCPSTIATITSYKRVGETTEYDRATMSNFTVSRINVDYSYQVGESNFIGHYITTASTARQRLKANYGMNEVDVEKEDQKEIGKTFTLYYHESNPKESRLQRPGSEPGKFVLSYLFFAGGGLMTFIGIIGILVILKEMTEVIQLQSFSTATLEASRTTQLVGENCVVCKIKISSILGAGFCPSCHHGVHDLCRQPQSLDKRCLTCGGST